ncbi:MAG TPA: SRPBCC family protein [Solirubrobacteraceae bacterium]|nr:SRPBCC family protein [Solirubrobacteraceae bacterium]
MPYLKVEASIDGADVDELFAHIERFETYPDIADNVRAVTVSDRTQDTFTSCWEVNFRNGILKWEELDSIDRENHRITFSQLQGDLASFTGKWIVDAVDGGARVEFSGEFDLGIPSLASMLDPVAVRTLTSNVRELIEAFGVAAGTPVSSFTAQDA